MKRNTYSQPYNGHVNMNFNDTSAANNLPNQVMNFSTNVSNDLKNFSVIKSLVMHQGLTLNNQQTF